MPEKKTLSHKRYLMYIIGFVFNLSYAIPTYINSSFLAKFTGDKLVGIIYTASSILAIAAFIETNKILKRFGNFRTTIGLLLLEILSLAGLATSNSYLVVVASFILNFVTIALINFTLDVFLEEFSNNKRTGKIRGAFLSISNSAWLIAPLFVSYIIGGEAYSNIYVMAGLLLIPVLLLIFFGLHNVKDPEYSELSFWKSFATVWADRNIKAVLFLQFLEQFFYAWMVIYTPIYLHEIIGFDWPVIGLIFTVLLTPFVILEAPLGWLADKIGEKTLLSLGFIVLGISTVMIAFITDHNPYIWAGILFMTRVGASVVEVMSDTYFFKHVDASKSQIISFSRMARPCAYVVAPVAATLLFTVFDMKGLFIFLGLLMLYGLRYSLSMKDTTRI